MAGYRLQLISQLQLPLQNEHNTFFIRYEGILRPGKYSAGQERSGKLQCAQISSSYLSAFVKNPE